MIRFYKKSISLMLAVLLCLPLAACSREEKTGELNPPPSATQEDTITPELSVTLPGAPSQTAVSTLPSASTTASGGNSAEPAQAQPVRRECVTGAAKENAGTYTGLSPLPCVTFEVTDPENSRGLSTKGVGYGFGVAKDGKPHDISINNQKLFDKYHALALDTKSTQKVLYLTFDCGYENGYTAKILDVLKEKKVPAAFFVTVPYLKDSPEIAARMIKEGHIVGNHSNTHPVFPTISRTKMAQEIQECDNYLREHFGYSAPFFRFPTGEYSDSALDLVQSLGYTSVFWSVAYGDYNVNKQKGKQYAFDKVTARLHPGAVLLLHAVSKDNTAALGEIIDWAREQGYVFKALTEYQG